MRDPGLRRKEDFPSGTRSAAIGGVTTVADMPNTVPAVTTMTALDAKAAELRGRAAVDYALYAAPQSPEEVARLADGVASKVDMAGRIGIATRSGTPCATDASTRLRATTPLTRLKKRARLSRRRLPASPASRPRSLS